MRRRKKMEKRQGEGRKKGAWTGNVGRVERESKRFREK